MKRFIRPTPIKVTLLAALTMFGTTSPVTWAESPVSLHNFEGTVDLFADGSIKAFALTGNASHLGNFRAYGEVAFNPGPAPGSLVGEGVAVFQSANGDLLVGVVSWDIDPFVNARADTGIQFHWRDFVTFSDGTVVASTGRFVDSHPPGLVVIAIIAIIIQPIIIVISKVPSR
jgi:hypothetical protein